MTDLKEFGLSPIEFPKVCVRISNSNFAEISLNELPNVVNVLVRFGFTCTIHQIND